jgi:hypothetical protein
MVTSYGKMFAFSGRRISIELNGVTYFASRASANTPAASGAAALVPEWVVVHFPYRSVVACQIQFRSITLEANISYETSDLRRLSEKYPAILNSSRTGRVALM